MRLFAILLASAIVVAVASAGTNAARPSALLTYTASPRPDPEHGQYLACIANGSRRLRIVGGDLSASAAAWNRKPRRVHGLEPAHGFRSGDEDDIVVADARGQLIENSPRASRRATSTRSGLPTAAGLPSSPTCSSRRSCRPTALSRPR